MRASDLSVFPLSLRPVGWMSPKQQQYFEQWLGPEPDRVANGEPGEKSGDANDCQSKNKVYLII